MTDLAETEEVVVATPDSRFSSPERLGLHLLEIGRIQNNSGSLLQFVAILFAVCIYFFNALVYPASPHRALYATVLAVDATLIVVACFFYLRCLTLSVGWSAIRNPQTNYHLLSTLGENEMEETLRRVIRSFRRGTYCFAASFFTTLVSLVLVALGYTNMLPS
ncbi:hypothetical protein [Rhodomicrobium lacus]|uniref:hypothetical protein n=1 Tax=Rhodomicrobium lacus TaxID=2498452 RepID=UPI000F8DFF7F|nr:hypothetical protein [Rhodomicrobium lacus]